MHAKCSRHDEEEEGISGQTRHRSITGIPKDIIAPLESEQDVLFSNYTHQGKENTMVQEQFGVDGTEQFDRSKKSVMTQLRKNPDNAHEGLAEDCRTLDDLLLFISGGLQ